MNGNFTKIVLKNCIRNWLIFPFSDTIEILVLMWNRVPHKLEIRDVLV